VFWKFLHGIAYALFFCSLRVYLCRPKGVALRCVGWRAIVSDSASKRVEALRYLSLTIARHATQRAAVMEMGHNCISVVCIDLCLILCICVSHRVRNEV